MGAEPRIEPGTQVTNNLRCAYLTWKHRQSWRDGVPAPAVCRPSCRWSPPSCSSPPPTPVQAWKYNSEKTIQNADDLLHLALLLLQHLYRQENITQRRQYKMQMISSILYFSSSNTCTGEKKITFPRWKYNSEKARVLHILKIIFFTTYIHSNASLHCFSFPV